MKKLFQFLGGYVVLEICGAACELALNRLMRENIAFWNIVWIDELTIRISVLPGQREKAVDTITSSMCDAYTVEEIGIVQQIRCLKYRIGLVLLVVFSIASAIILPKYVFFYEVVGNETIPSEWILRELQNHGIGFGTYGPDIHPAWAKNHMINVIPKLQWLTITQNGCRAKVIVRERPDIPKTEDRKGFSNVVATQNGLITQMSVFAGQPVVKTGDTVIKGQILVSGIVDLERIYVLENANAEIFARTWREITACLPKNYAKKGEISEKKTEVSIQIGQKRIKLFGNSGISHGSCDKMITRLELTLPGNLVIPLSLEVSQVTFYDKKMSTMPDEEAERLLTSYVTDYVRRHLRAGEILGSSFRMAQDEDKHLLHGVMECHEMIAERVSGKITFED